MKWRGLALLACLAVAGCAPVYLADLDKAASLTNHMTMVGTVGPFSIGSGIANLRFLPTKTTATSIGGVSVQSGFIVYDSGVNENLLFASGPGQTSNNNAPMPLSGADPNYPLYQYDVTNTINNQPSVMVFHWDPTTPANDTYQQFVASLSNGGMSPLAMAASLSGVFSGISIIGGSILPAQPPSYDSFAVLGPSAFGTGVNGSGGSLTSLGLTSFVLSGPTTRSLYYFNVATGTSFASFYSVGQWTCLQVFSSGSYATMSGIPHRVDAVLSSGDLLSTEGGTLRLYDPNGAGTEVLSVPLSGLQFCYETYVGKDLYVFFSLPVSLQHNQWVFNVYVLPSSAMRGLGK
jgi:hypothetical protein